jgi:hypothetical protein
MSFIRSISNNEGIYVICSSRGIEFMRHPSSFILPPHVFYGVIRKCILDGENAEDYSYRGARLWFSIENGEALWKLSYKNDSVKFTDVVLRYIITVSPECFCNKKEFMEYIGGHRFKWSSYNKKRSA